MRRPPGIEQQHPFAGILQLLRRPGAEHAGADDDRVEPRRRRRILRAKRFRHRGGRRRSRPGEEQRAAAEAHHPGSAGLRSRSACEP